MPKLRQYYVRRLPPLIGHFDQ
ncbi:hypothetical protein THIOKS12580017 [Thiocapsa sp. KS1]|nr:hypothetical protein THIOKS12580017 [Thiocapsa sp. KS1]